MLALTIDVVSLEYGRDLPRPKTTAYAPRMNELQVPVKKLLMPPSTINTPTAMLTRRLHGISTGTNASREEPTYKMFVKSIAIASLKNLRDESDLQLLRLANQ
jgi:hypothetical protein